MPRCISRACAVARGLAHCQKGLAAVEFVLIAPIVMTLGFATIVYSLYFMTLFGVREAAGEGARAAVSGLTTTERSSLAKASAQAVIDNYGSLLNSGGQQAQVTAAKDGSGVFKVVVSYDMSNSPIMRAGGFLPLPNSKIEAAVVVANGSY